MRRYTGNTDGLAAGPKPGTEELLRLASKRWGFTNLGIFSNRRMNNDKARANPQVALSIWAIRIEQLLSLAGTFSSQTQKN
jgi:hypothetical protein